MTAKNLISEIEVAAQRVLSKIINFGTLVEEDFAAFEAWVASKAPAADAALQELASLATIAAPLAGASPAVSAGLAAVVTVADQADAVIHAVAANQTANKALGLVNTAHSIMAISAAINSTSGAIAQAHGNLSTAIAQAVKTATPAAPAPVSQ